MGMGRNRNEHLGNPVGMRINHKNGNEIGKDCQNPFPVTSNLSTNDCHLLITLNVVNVPPLCVQRDGRLVVSQRHAGALASLYH